MDNSRERRLDVIRAIQDARGSKVITYICGDRQGPPGYSAQIGEDAVRPLYDHLLGLSDYGTLPKVDLYLYSRGGAVDVPWRIVSMIRAFAKRFGVLVPFRAHSAATLITLGADEVVLGRKGELGPIDPILNIQRQGNEGTAVQEQISVEDVMAYLNFVRERAGVTDQSGLIAALGALNEAPGPVLLGNIYRTHSHIRAVAAKMLESHVDGLEEQKSTFIIETLAERTYAHGHAISRTEAREIGLPVADDDTELERLMWDLYLCYESELRLLEPMDPVSFLAGADKKRESITSAIVESEWGLTSFSGEMEVEVQRQWPPQLQINVNLNLPMPDGAGAESLPEAQNAAFQQLAGQLQQQLPNMIQSLVQQEVARQAPVKGYKSTLVGARWQNDASASSAIAQATSRP
ncbi:MAG: SDH family Clp fold serine proteinase [Thermoleophilia bacterium]